MIEVVLVRHGETAWNIAGRIQGYSADSPLTETGAEQATAVARRLAREGIGRLVSSDAGRARDTVKPIAQETGLVAFFDVELRERNYGIFEGRTYTEIEREFPADYQAIRSRDPHYRVPGGESAAQFVDRAVRALTRIAQFAQGGRVVVVTHGGVLGAMYRHATGLPLNAKRDFPLKNASINRLRFARGAWALTAWGDVSHLDDRARDDD